MTDAEADDAVIVTRGLSKVYPGGLTAVDDLHLSVRRGEIFALLGPNGAGKTTTVGMLTTRVRPTAGTALVDGIDVVADPAGAKAVLGVVPQSNTLDRSLTVRENLYFHARYFGHRHRAASALAGELLERFRLTGRAAADVGTLSGGMARRLILARALLARPAVVFLDEPTAGLDPQSRLVLWEMVEQLHAEGETILLTTHYMEEAERLAERVAIMDRGRLLALDTPAGLRRSVAAGAVVVLRTEGDLDRLAGRLRAEPGVRDADITEGGLRLRLTDADGTVARIVAAASAGGYPVRGLSVSEATLETVFLGLTGEELRE
ncbi:MAG TPA: ABC transporter ATP-binding protein [Acidimicrobiales bacterium]|nr:ABC transporter ATP-binding protein [Acidimicrobiales bacterium]